MIVLIGKTCSGKNHVRDLLVEHGKKKVVTYTTRPMREGEIDGETYHFLSKDEFLKKISDDFFQEYTSYRVTGGDTWFYGSHLTEEDDNSVVILNPDGLKSVLKSGLKPYVVYVDAPKRVLRERVLSRGDSIEEFERRLNADDIDFNGIEKYVNSIINNDGSMTDEEILSAIKSTY